LPAPTGIHVHLPGPYRAVVADLDGLLVRTEDLWWQAKEILFARHGVEFTPADHLAVFGTSDEYTAACFARRFGAPPEAEAEDAIRVEYLGITRELFGRGVEPAEGATQLIEHLLGRVPLGLASNTRREQVDSILASLPFRDAFDVVVTGDDGVPKPAPDLYLEACRRLGVAPADSVALEDSPTGVAAALAAGLTCIGVPSHPDEGLADAHVVVRSLRDLLDPAA
jgi:HAD superfamily hydrolase (TIGR01509 family)